MAVVGEKEHQDVGFEQTRTQFLSTCYQKATRKGPSSKNAHGVSCYESSKDTDELDESSAMTHMLFVHSTAINYKPRLPYEHGRLKALR